MLSRAQSVMAFSWEDVPTSLEELAVDASFLYKSLSLERLPDVSLLYCYNLLNSKQSRLFAEANMLLDAGEYLSSFEVIKEVLVFASSFGRDVFLLEELVCLRHYLLTLLGKLA